MPNPTPGVAIRHSNRLVAELGALDNDVIYRIYPKVADAGSLGAHFGLLETDSPDLQPRPHRLAAPAAGRIA